MSLAQHSLEMLRYFGVIQRVLYVVAGAGTAVGQCDVEVDLQGLRHDLFALIYSDERGDFEFAQEDDVHEFCLLVAYITWRKIRRTFILRHSRC